MGYFVYAIRSQSRPYIYVGLTDNVERRLGQHNAGYSRTTAPYRPFELVLIEEHPDRQAARDREKFLKSGKGKEFLKNLRTIGRVVER